MTYYFKVGNSISIEPKDSLEVLRCLPTATYTVKEDPLTKRLSLQTTNPFDLPEKIYGNAEPRSKRVISTFLNREKSTGVLLSGDKGSGKTLLTKLISRRLHEHGISTIIVNEAFCGPKFNELIGNIREPALVVFDEFDKVYDEDDQEHLLTLLDGTVETKKLFILTTNKGHVDDNLINRPGRVYYKFNYSGIDEEFVSSYVADNLKNNEYAPALISLVGNFHSFTFDMLQTIVEEMNRYNEPVSKVLNGLNIDFYRQGDGLSYDIDILYDGEHVTNRHHPNVFYDNPLMLEYGSELSIYPDKKHTIKPDFTNSSMEDEEDPSAPRLVSSHSESRSFDDLEISQRTLYKVSAGGKMTFRHVVNDKELLIILTKRNLNRQFDFFAF